MDATRFEESELRARMLIEIGKLREVTPAIEALPLRTLEAFLQELRMKQRRQGG